jgi:hypothetical protein
MSLTAFKDVGSTYHTCQNGRGDLEHNWWGKLIQKWDNLFQKWANLGQNWRNLGHNLSGELGHYLSAYFLGFLTTHIFFLSL